MVYSSLSFVNEKKRKGFRIFLVSGFGLFLIPSCTNESAEDNQDDSSIGHAIEEGAQESSDEDSTNGDSSGNEEAEPSSVPESPGENGGPPSSAEDSSQADSDEEGPQQDNEESGNSENAEESDEPGVRFDISFPMPETGDEGSDCPEERLCGEDCCEEGQLCYAGQCYIDCGDGTPGCGDAPGECCADAEICYLDKCVAPGADCTAACATSPGTDICDSDEVCDPVLEKCVPKEASEDCTYEPPEGVFDPTPAFSWGKRQARACNDAADCQLKENCVGGSCVVTWTHLEPGAGDLPTYHQISSIPLVIDVDQDCVPELIFNTYQNSTITSDGVIRAIRGDNGAKVWTVNQPEYRTDSTSNLAAGDIDRDGAPEIIAQASDSAGKYLIAIDSDGSPLWKSDNFSGDDNSGSPAIANIDGEDDPEIVFGAAVFDSDGKRRWEGNQGVGINNQGPISCLADLNNDERPELIAGGTAYTFTGDIPSGDFNGSVLWNSDANDGFCGVTDFDVDGSPEIVVVSKGLVSIVAGSDGTVLATFTIPGGGRGGASNIEDFDGDGLPEVGIAGGTRYVVLEFDSDKLNVSVLWYAITEDDSSNVTGSTVFDFDGDNQAEVVYSDEHFFRIYPGVEPDCQLDPPGPKCDGIMDDDEVLMKELNSSRTRTEYPVVADVDGDYKAELVVVTNNESTIAPEGDAGLEVWRDELNNWVPTRAVWNQHSYHITNIEVDGTIPVSESDNWTTPESLPYNNYRSNSAGELNLCAPDLIPKGLSVDESQCPDIVVSVWVVNQGCLGVGAGLKVAFFEEDGGHIGIALTTGPLPAGAAEKVTLTLRDDKLGDLKRPYTIHAIVDDDGAGNGEINECVEDNNTSDPIEVCVPNIVE